MSYRFNPTTGLLDLTGDSGGPPAPSDVAREINLLVELGEDMSALKAFYLGSDQKAYIANAGTDFETAQAIGILKQSGVAGELVEGLLFGKMIDPFFNFPINADLYLASNGNLTNLDPQSLGLQFNKVVAQSLGVGSIFINIKKTIIL